MTAEALKKLKTAESEKISHIDYFNIAISVDCVIFGFEKKLGMLSKGVHKISLDKDERNSFSPGIYLLRVSVKNSIQTKKILLY